MKPRDESLLKNAPPPLVFNPYAKTQEDIDEARAMIEREIEELREILSRPRHGARRAD